MSSLIAHHTWPVALGVFVAGAFFITAGPRLYFRWLAHWDKACDGTDALDSAAEPAPPNLSLAAAARQPRINNAAH